MSYFSHANYISFSFYAFILRYPKSEEYKLMMFLTVCMNDVLA
jgi:hypothetical protein